jgi:tetratricopeptide (TPR) repeat protein
VNVCLVSIVKNEERTIGRMLFSVAPHIHAWVICDTGSTDDTTWTIQKCAEQVSPALLGGVVRIIRFEDFSQARNEALRLAREYLVGREEALENWCFLLLDADMELVARHGLHVPVNMPEAYTVEQRSGDLAWSNVRLLRASSSARFVGATHEVLINLAGRPLPFDDVHIVDHCDGGSRGDKFERDLRLLTVAHANDPQDARTVYYLAQTLRDLERYGEAMNGYRRRAAMGGFAEEAWHAQYQAAAMALKLGRVADFIEWTWEAYNMRPTRAEPLVALAYFYRVLGRHDACCAVAELARSIPRPADALFVEPSAYGWRPRFELSVAGFYSSIPIRRQRGAALCAQLTTERTLPAAERELAAANLEHYVRAGLFVP